MLLPLTETPPMTLVLTQGLLHLSIQVARTTGHKAGSLNQWKLIVQCPEGGSPRSSLLHGRLLVRALFLPRSRRPLAVSSLSGGRRARLWLLF